MNFSARLISCLTLSSFHRFLPAAASSAASSTTTPSTLIPPQLLTGTSLVADNEVNSSNESSEPMSASSQLTFKRAVFSDVDGTLVHYPEHLKNGSVVADNGDDADSDLIYLPPSKTGTRGVISAGTLKLCHRLRHGDASSSNETIETETIADTSSSSNKPQRIRNGGVPFVLVSGMRTTTLFQRLPYLPRADAYVSESGGRIFYPRPISDGADDNDTTITDAGTVKGLTIQPVSYPGVSPSDVAHFSLVEDMDWRDRISQLTAAGRDGYNDDTPVEERNGKLWEFARRLSREGYALDSSGYATAYRVNRKHQKSNNNGPALTFDEFLDRCANNEDIPEGLDCSTNLGCVDIYPAMSGKRKCVEYLLQKFLAAEEDSANNESIAKEKPIIVSLKTHAYCLCDDDNDIEMALACRAAYLPSVTSDSIRTLVESQSSSGDDGHLMLVTEDAEKGVIGSLATEAALEAILKELLEV